MVFRTLLNLTSSELPLTLSLTKCINVTSGAIPCNRCRDVCPEQAIENTNPLVINSEKCNGCGLCQGICPMEAIRVKGFNPKAIFDAVRTTRKIACKLSGQAENKVACLAAVPMELWAAIAITCRDNLVEVFCGDCGTCFGGRVVNSMKQTLSKITQTKLKFSLGNTVTENTEAGSRLSRRELFLSLRKRTADMVVSAMPSGTEEATAQKTCREILLEVISQNPAETPVNLPGIICVSECSGCGVCESFCPTDAWKKSEASILYNRQLCVGCNTCVQMCPKECLQLSMSPLDENSNIMEIKVQHSGVPRRRFPGLIN